MNYQKIYEQIVKRALNRVISGYTEKHHIIPICMGGEDDSHNIVILTAREHFLCHWLLCKIYKNDYKLASAFNYMCVSSRWNPRGLKSSKLFEIARKHFSKCHPTKDPKVCEKISNTLKNNENLSYRKKRVDKICKCGKIYTVIESSIQQYCSRACSSKYTKKNVDYEKVSKTLKTTLNKLTEEELSLRSKNSFGNCDQKKRGLSISQGKKGKKTNQQEIMGKRFASMSDTEFENYLTTKSHYVHKRTRNLRQRYLNERNHIRRT